MNVCGICKNMKRNISGFDLGYYPRTIGPEKDLSLDKIIVESPRDRDGHLSYF